MCRSVQYSHRSKSLLRRLKNDELTAFNIKGRYQKLAIAAHVLKNTCDFDILLEDGKEMYKDSKRTVLLIKPFVWRRSRRRFGFLPPPPLRQRS